MDPWELVELCRMKFDPVEEVLVLTDDDPDDAVLVLSDSGEAVRVLMEPVDVLTECDPPEDCRVSIDDERGACIAPFE